MLPETAQKPILSMLGDHTNVRIGLGVPYDPGETRTGHHPLFGPPSQALEGGGRGDNDGTTIVASLSVYYFSERMNNIHETRLTTLRYYVPSAVMFMLIGVAMVAMGFTGYQAGGRETRGRVATLIMSLMVPVVIMLIVDLDQPARGFIEVSTRHLADAELGIPP
jgi:hypothetical protein